MKRLFNLVLVFFVALLFVSCDLLEDDSKSGPKAPDMGSPADLPISGVTRSPASEQEGKTMFLDVATAIRNGIADAAPVLNLTGNRSASRAVDPINSSYSWIVGDSINVTQSSKGEFYEDDRLADLFYGDPLPVGNYSPAYSINVQDETLGTFKNAILGLANYTVNGNVIRNEKVSGSTSINVTASGNTESSNTYFELSTGAALSIVTTDGVGAKFIFSYADAFSFSEDENTTDSERIAFSNDVNNRPVEVRVYDMNNEHIFTCNLVLENIEG